MSAARKTSPEPSLSDHQVCFGNDTSKPPTSKIRCFSEKFQARFTPNTVKNQKYNAFNFLPIVFYGQFKFFSNLYFLLVALSQFVPALKIGLCSLPLRHDLFTGDIIGFIVTYVAPLAFVFFVTMGKEAYDDYKRHLRDNEANSAKYLILESPGVDATSSLDGGPHTRAAPSSSIRVCDLILLERTRGYQQTWFCSGPRIRVERALLGPISWMARPTGNCELPCLRARSYIPIEIC